MTRRTLAAALALTAFLAAGAAEAGERSPQDQALYEKARKDCSGPQWPNGATPYINYAGGWYRCVEPGSSRR